MENNMETNMDYVVAMNHEKGNVITAFYIDENGGLLPDKPIVNGELRLDYVPFEEENRLIEYVLITKQYDQTKEEETLNGNILERAVLIEFYKLKKGILFLDWYDKKIFSLGNNPSYIKKKLSKTVSDWYIWNDTSKRIIDNIKFSKEKEKK